MSAESIKKISELIPDSRNANRGTPRGNAMVGHSLRQYGAGRSILIDMNGKIIAGNKTAENAAAAGLVDVKVIESDGSKLIAVQRTDLNMDTDPRARELALLDNRTSQVGLEWDADIIAAFADEGLDMSAMFTGQELADIVDAIQDAVSEAPSDFASVDESIETAYQCPKCGYEWSGQPK
jgi:rubrerythrin